MQPISGDLGDGGVGAQAHIPLPQGLFRLLAAEGAGLGQQGRTLLDQLDDRAALDQVSEFAGQLHTGGASPHHRQALQRASRMAELLHQVLEALHIDEVAEAEAVDVRARYTEELGTPPRGDHQAAIGKAATAGGVDLLLAGIDAIDPVLQPAHPLAGQQGVVAGGDLPAPQFAAEQLVEQRQKQEALLRFDQQNRRMATALGEGQSGVEAGEAPPDDDDRRTAGAA